MRTKNAVQRQMENENITMNIYGACGYRKEEVDTRLTDGDKEIRMETGRDEELENLMPCHLLPKPSQRPF